MLGYCGIHCTDCSAYKATVTTDQKLMQHVETTFGDGKGTRNDWVCLGCQPAEQPFLAEYCASCKIRNCAIEHRVGNCAACHDYEECERLHAFIKEEDEALVLRMQWLREAFLERSQPAS